MVSAIPGQPLFKMVALRGADQDRFVDPTETSSVDVEFIDSVDLDELDAPDTRIKIRNALARTRILTEDDLGNFVELRKIRTLLTDDSSVDLLTESISVNRRKVKILDYARSKVFLESYGQLYNSWLAIRLERAADLGDRYALGEQHSDLLRIAEIVRRTSVSNYSPRVIDTLMNAPIVYPGRWRRGVLSRVNDLERRERAGYRLESKKLIKEREEKVAAIDSMNDLQRVLPQLRHDPLYAELAAQPLSQGMGDLIVSRLPQSKRAGVAAVLVDYGGLTIDGMTNETAHDRGKWLDDANSLCSKIRLFEDYAHNKLPDANAVASENRPSIRSIGIGDLVVARESLERYEATEIAHIENIMPGETKVREHERTNSTTDFLETEVTEDSVNERDFETSDRFELQTESQKSMKRDFALKAGVNTSGKYGLTTVNTSVDAAFNGSNSESTKTTIETAQEIVSKSVERIQNTVRELRRKTTVEQVREFSRHSFENKTPPPDGESTAINGAYYWVDKIQNVELRHYGTRLMFEFHIPEPGVTLLEQMQIDTANIPKPAPLTVGPQDIQEANYLCLAKLYGAEGVKAPPPFQKQAGLAFASRPKDDKDSNSSEVTFKGNIVLDPGYYPYDVLCSVSGRGLISDFWAQLVNGGLPIVDAIHVHVAVAGQEIMLRPGEGEASQPSYSTVTQLTYPLMSVESTGLPVTAVVSGPDDGTATMNIEVFCYRTQELMDQWRIETYEKIKLAHRALVEEYEQEVAQLRFQQDSLLQFDANPPLINRQTERDELKKWAIKLLRVDNYDFDAIVGAGIDGDTFQEIDAGSADQEAPVVNFFETSFEWTHMSYFLYPYFWSRRDSWNARLAVKVPDDYAYEQFLKAGYARVIVPVAPGREDHVLSFVSQDSNLSDKDRINVANGQVGSDLADIDDPLWLELRANSDREIALGNGKLRVRADRKTVEIVSNEWKISEVDLGREIFVNADAYTITDIDKSLNLFSIKPEFSGDTEEEVSFASGSVLYGQPWRVKVPTRLVYLHDGPLELGI